MIDNWKGKECLLIVFGQVYHVLYYWLLASEKSAY